MQDDFVLGGKCPGRIVKITRRKISWEFFLSWEEKAIGLKYLGGKFGKKMWREENFWEDSVTQSLFYKLIFFIFMLK